MRGAWLALLLFVGVAQAAQTVQLTDVSGDATVKGAPVPGLDILDATVTIDGTNLTFALHTDDVDTVQRVKLAAPLAAWEFWLEARYRGDTFHFVIDTALGAFPDPEAPGTYADTTTAALYRLDDGAWVKLHQGFGQADPTNDIWSATYPLATMAAKDGFVPGPGEPIEFLEVVAYFDEGAGSSHEYPREGANIPQQNLAGGDQATFPVNSVLALAGASSSALTLATPMPVRFSNGEATTYHWPVSVTNTRTGAMDVVLEATAPPEVELRLPEVVHLDAGQARIVDVYATVPFSHQHGGQRIIEVIATTGPDQATIPLTVQYLEVPQPAGHHPTLFLHADNAGGGDSGMTWLDTLEEPVRYFDAQMNLGPQICKDGDTGQNTVGFYMPLDPALLIGIDGRLGEAAKFTGTFDFPAPVRGGFLAAHLKVYDTLHPDEWLNIDDATARHPLTMGASGSIDVELDLALPPELDLLAPGAGKNFALHFALCGDGTADLAAVPNKDLIPKLAHGARIEMPLDEYHDVLPLAVGNGPTLSVQDAKLRAPQGSTVQWLVHVDGSKSYDVDLFGVSKGLASITQSGDDVTVNLAVPHDARDGDVLEVVVSVTERGDDLLSAATRLVVTVDPTAPAPATLGGPGSKDTPAPGMLIVAVLAIALLCKRKR